MEDLKRAKAEITAKKKKKIIPKTKQLEIHAKKKKLLVLDNPVWASSLNVYKNITFYQVINVVTFINPIKLQSAEQKLLLEQWR